MVSVKLPVATEAVDMITWNRSSCRPADTESIWQRALKVPQYTQPGAYSLISTPAGKATSHLNCRPRRRDRGRRLEGDRHGDGLPGGSRGRCRERLGVDDFRVRRCGGEPHGEQDTRRHDRCGPAYVH
ncbi:hypothetical protein AB0H43_12110 [Hamadaea sp. NPDC050747]|uniref:hypothetical protein n=1 Tax=Hamadaea sp. NPDC050747 TaxID=3155789 RepID=UPI003400739F